MWNQWLDKLKFSSVKICAAKNLNPYTKTYIQPCEKYSYRKYCAAHSIELTKACAQYHYIGNLSHDDPMLHFWAQKELDERIEFCQRFSISTDYGHAKWNEHLRNIIDRGEQKRVLFEEIKRERHLQRLNHVLEDTVCSNQIKNCSMLLFYADDYESNGKNAGNYDDDWNDSLNLQNENPCDELTIKQYLFQNYFKRSSLSDVKYLNLFETERKINQNVDEEW